MEIKAFGARRDAIHAVGGVANDVLYDVLGFSAGTVNALGNNLTLGVLPRCNLPHNASARGQQLGDGLSVAIGYGRIFHWRGHARRRPGDDGNELRLRNTSLRTAANQALRKR